MRKENQDSALALREYRSGNEALFGVFDGHGPNGGSHLPCHVPQVDPGIGMLDVMLACPMQGWYQPPIHSCLNRIIQQKAVCTVPQQRASVLPCICRTPHMAAQIQ